MKQKTGTAFDASRSSIGWQGGRAAGGGEEAKSIASAINREERPGKRIVEMDNQYSQTFNWGEHPTALVSIARAI